jgi:drug/metabolite transporter (DMT)-like permease
MAVLPLLVLLVLGGRHGPRRRRETRSALPQLVPMALLSVVATVTYFVAIDRMSVALVTLVIYVYPAVTVVGSRLLGWTSLGAVAVLSTTLTLAGVVITLGLPDDPVDALAVGLAVINGVSYAMLLLCAQVALRKTDSLTAYAAAGGPAAVLLLLGAFVVADPDFGSGAVAVASLAAAGLISTILATLLQLSGVKRVGSASAAVVTSIEIVTVVVASAVVFGDPIGIGLAVGAVLVIAGATLAPRGLRPLRGSGTPRSSSDDPRTEPAASRS